MSGNTIIRPEQPVIDAHHHMWRSEAYNYLLDEYLSDISAGHNIIASVHVQANDSWYRSTGPEPLRPVGETEYCVAAHGEALARSGIAVVAGIVGYADLMLGDAVQEVLEAHIAAGAGLFRGLRVIAPYDPTGSVELPGVPVLAGLYNDVRFRAGFARLAPLGLSFDAWHYHLQLRDLIGLARAFPNTAIIADHCGGVLNTGAYAGHEQDVFDAWARDMRELARCPNVSVKISGFGMQFWGFSFRAGDGATAVALADAWRPYADVCLDAFGAGRSMFASNFPMDRSTCCYVTLWNALKLLVVSASEDEITALCSGTARRVYRLAV